MQKGFAIFALTFGLFAAYVDTRPKWDDTGVLVISLLLVSGLLSLASPRRPWLWAILVGVWVPLAEITMHHGLASLAALAFTFVGAYAGWGVRKVLALGMA